MDMLELTHFQFCPKCGSQDISDQDVKAMRCGHCGLIYYHNTASAAAGIIEADGRIILARRRLDPHQGKLDLPGGFVDYGETYEEALAREIKEELNWSVCDVRYFCSFPNRYEYRGISYFTADIVFLCRVEDLSPLCLSAEVSEIVALKTDEIILDDIPFSSMRRAIEKYIREKV
jgi:NAD+ diphosphatase